MSRLERGTRSPSLEVVLAAQILFGLTTLQLFPKQHTEAEEHVMRTAAIVSDAWEKDATLRGTRKRELLDHVRARVISRSSSYEL
jgi:hypothetical protein